MQTTLSPNQTASAIWSRIVKPERATFTPELARAILKLDFDREDHRRDNLKETTDEFMKVLLGIPSSTCFPS